VASIEQERSALCSREFEDLLFATHDQELALAARAMGFRVLGARSDR
jgi:hypothetical protein